MRLIVICFVPFLLSANCTGQIKLDETDDKGNEEYKTTEYLQLQTAGTPETYTAGTPSLLPDSPVSDYNFHEKRYKIKDSVQFLLKPKKE